MKIQLSSLTKIPLSSKKLLVIFAIVIFAIVFYYQFFVKKHLEIVWPNGREVLRAGHSYTIKWKARKIEKIDIVLFQDEEPKRSKVLVKDFPAKKKKYQWEVFPFEQPSDRYQIVIFESPWDNKKKIDYSDDYFTIIGPRFVSCEQLAIKNNWPFIPEEYPGLKRVFITDRAYSGNLGGLEKADEICQKEAQLKGLEGNWKALLGDEKISAVERLNLDGIFVYAIPEKGLPQEKIPAYFWESFKDYLNKVSRTNEKLKKELNSAHDTLTPYFSEFFKRWNLLQENKGCLRFLGKDFEHFFQRLTAPYFVISDSPEKDFLEEFFEAEIWLGRIKPEDPKECITLHLDVKEDRSRLTSFTSTCQNWSTSASHIKEVPKEHLPFCYLEVGQKVEALGIGGIAKIVLKEKEGEDKIINVISGKNCGSYLKLICVEQ